MYSHKMKIQIEPLRSFVFPYKGGKYM